MNIDFVVRVNRVNPYPEVFNDGIPVPVTRDPTGVETENLQFALVNGQRKVITEWLPPADGDGLDCRRHGVGYNYQEDRNALMMDIIHITALAKSPPPVIGSPAGEIFRGQHGVTLNNMFLTLTDALAYCALYPEN